MKEIAGMIENGSMTFLKKEYSILGIFIVVVAALLWMNLGMNTALCYVIGALVSMFCGFIGMKAATKSSKRLKEGLRWWV